MGNGMIVLEYTVNGKKQLKELTPEQYEACKDMLPKSVKCITCALQISNHDNRKRQGKNTKMVLHSLAILVILGLSYLSIRYGIGSDVTTIGATVLASYGSASYLHTLGG